jgi:hypothetical protein
MPVAEAFSATGDRAAQSQAALLLTLGNVLRYRDRRFEPTTEALALAAAAPAEAEPPPLEDDEREQLGIPATVFDLAAERGTRIDLDFVRESVGPEMLAARAPGGPPAAAAAVAREAAPRLAERLLAEPNPVNAAALIDASLASEDELVRVAAAAAEVEVALEHQLGEPLAVLARGARSTDPLVRDIAATSLAKVEPGHPQLVELIRPGPASAEGEPAETSLLIHGTWARNNAWWQPGGGFHTFVRTNVDPNLYSAADRFEWSGGWSDAARALAGLELVAWAQGHGVGCLDVFAHSHGGSVAMLASTALDIGRMVLLSCPVHWHKYRPNFARVQRTISIRVRGDLVILADGGRQRFRDPRIEEIVLPIWFNHSTSHEPATWVNHGLAGRIGAPIC